MNIAGFLSVESEGVTGFVDVAATTFSCWGCGEAGLTTVLLAGEAEGLLGSEGMIFAAAT
jgi:hypothetical protein